MAIFVPHPSPALSKDQYRLSFEGHNVFTEFGAQCRCHFFCDFYYDLSSFKKTSHILTVGGVNQIHFYKYENWLSLNSTIHLNLSEKLVILYNSKSLQVVGILNILF